MRKSFEIRKDLAAKKASLEAEKDAEKQRTIASEVVQLINELNMALANEAADRAMATSRILTEPEKKELCKFSFRKFILEASSKNGLTGFEKEMSQEAEKEFSAAGKKLSYGIGLPFFLLRDYTANNSSTAGEGQEFNQVNGWDYAGALQNASIAHKLGVRFLTGLSGSFKVVKGGGATAYWLPEEGKLNILKQNFTTALMSPKRIAVGVKYTRDMLMQNSMEIDQILMDELSSAHAAKLDGTIFSGSGTSGEPYGIINTAGVAAVAAGASFTRDVLVDMKTKVAEKNANYGSLNYAVGATLSGELEKTPQVAGYPLYLIDGGKITGYPVAVSNGITAKKAIFGNFNEVWCGEWAGLDFLVNPYSQDDEAVIKVTAYAYHDVLVRRPECFAVGTQD